MLSIHPATATGPLLLLLCAACSGGDMSRDMGADSGTAGTGDGGLQSGSDAMAGSGTDAGEQTGLHSTLVSDCGTLQGRAIVNFNDNLGITFTEDESPYTFLASVQFELTSGYTGAIPNPENWDGNGAREIVAMTTAAFDTHGNHCWLRAQPAAAGSVVISEYRPSQGIVRAEFQALTLRSCVGDSVCTISGELATTGEGVFE